jgi:hypothetical protein
MPALTFYTVTNSRYYPGAIATLSSIRRFHPECVIWVFSETRCPLTAAQTRHLASLSRVRHVSPADVPVGLVKEAWQLKAHAAHFLSRNTEGCLIQVDSDAILCSDVAVLAGDAVKQKVPAGGKDGKGVRYDHPKFAPYHALCGVESPAATKLPVPYISTSILFLPLPTQSGILSLWSAAVDEAIFGPKNRPRRIYPGYGDQGIFNALLHFKQIAPLVLDNDLVSQHWVHGLHKLEIRDGVFWNNGRRQIAFHSVGHSPKFWTPEYPHYVAKHGNLNEVYAYWLWLLFEGPCGILQSVSREDCERRRADHFPGLGHDLYSEYLKRIACASSPSDVILVA